MKNIKYLSLIFLVSLFFTACVDQEFDEPPYYENGQDPEISGVVKSMNDVKALSSGGAITQITEDWFLQGIVISDDEPGNFYKVLYLQDEVGTGGIQVSIDVTELHANFPLNRRVFVNLNGLYIGKSNNAWTLGIEPEGDLISRIPQGLVNDYVLGGMYNVSLAPTVLTLDEIDDELHGNTWVQIVGMQFPDGSLNGTYAELEGNITVNHELVDCDDNGITLRNSGYADFADEIVPSGNGTITAVYSVYRDFKQLFINKPSDIEFNGDRCGSGSGSETNVDLATLRSSYSNGATVVPEETKVRGIVISDQSNGNAPHSQNIVIQDATGGIEIRFTGDHSFNLNDEVEIVVSLAELEDYNGSLQVNNVSLSSAKLVGTGNIEPKLVTIQELLDNIWEWQATLVVVNDVTIESGTFSGNKSMEDATGSITLFTWDNASFSNETVPSGAVSVTGIVSKYNETQQLKMRSRSDVSGGGAGTEGIFNEDFEGGLGNWTSFSVKGSQVWQIDDIHGNPGSCAKMSGFEGSSHENDDWLISPVFDLSAVMTASLQFETAMNYSGNELELFLSSDYSGTGDPSVATWETVSYAKSSGDWDWISSGAIDLSSYVGGNVYMGLRFTSTDSESSTWEVDNVVVK